MRECTKSSFMENLLTLVQISVNSAMAGGDMLRRNIQVFSHDNPLKYGCKSEINLNMLVYNELFSSQLGLYWKY